jgi:amino acid transporter
MTSSAIKKNALQQIGLIYFVFVMYSYDTAGPFGLEDQVANSGPGMTLIYHLVLPLFWCIPISLVAAELTTAMPVEGGFYRWVRAAFGDFWGFLAGWWNWSASFLLGGAYAVLFTDYFVFYFPKVTAWKHYLICLCLIAVVAWVNVRGIKMIGTTVTVLEVFILLPVIIMIVKGLTQWRHDPFLPIVPPNKPLFQVFGTGLALGLWLYAGYEQLSTVAGEVENPQRIYPLALAMVVPLSIATYFLPTFAALAALGNWQSWRSGYFAEAGRLIGGTWLGFWMTLAAMVTNLSILTTTMLASSRMPFAMAEDGYFPPFLARIHPRYGTPYLAVVASAVIYALLAVQTLTQLINIYIWLRIATSVMTVLAAWRLRRSHPNMPRPFVIPGGRTGLIYAVGAPVLMSVLALLASNRHGLTWGPVAIAVGPLVYLLVQRKSAARDRTTAELFSSRNRSADS